jgi:uncharacterized membrane protein
MGENHFAPVPTAAYGADLLCSGIAYVILQSAILRLEGPDSRLARAIGSDAKGKLSAALYASAIPLAFVNRWISVAIYALVSAMWLAPDPRIESKLHQEENP